MRTIYIKFLSDEDRIEGLNEMATLSSVDSLPGRIYEVPMDALSLLDAKHIGYRRASDIEVRVAHGQIRYDMAAFGDLQESIERGEAFDLRDVLEEMEQEQKRFDVGRQA